MIMIPPHHGSTMNHHPTTTVRIMTKYYPPHPYRRDSFPLIMHHHPYYYHHRRRRCRMGLLSLSFYDSLFVGFDLGTSGARISIIQRQPQAKTTTTTTTTTTTAIEPNDVVVSSSFHGPQHGDDDNNNNNSNNNNNHHDSDRNNMYHEVFSDSVLWNQHSLGSYDDPNAWMDAIYQLFQKAKEDSNIPMHHIRSICFSGTSSSCVLVQRTNASSTTTTKIGNDDPHDPTTTTTIIQNRPYDIIEPTRGNQRARMYNYNVMSHHQQHVLDIIQQYVPKYHTASSLSSTFAKFVEWYIESPIRNDETPQQPQPQQEYLCHQADYLARQFLQHNDDEPFTIPSDWHNCLKLGYNVQTLQYPSWFIQCFKDLDCPLSSFPYPVVSPGQSIGWIRPDVATYFGLSNRTHIIAGTTDSNAAFFAAVSSSSSSSEPIVLQPGIAVTSLGSTLAMKHLSSSYVEDANRGVYSHRFPSTLIKSSSSSSLSSPSNNNKNDNDNDDQHHTHTSSNSNSNIQNNRNTKQVNEEKEWWLVGGASNVGCSILRHLNFTNDELDHLSNHYIDPNQNSPYDTYYPLVKRGERFPIADPMKEPILTPIPKYRYEYLHGILQSMTYVERDGYITLGQLGCIPYTPFHILTCGGGSKNQIWNQMRQRIFQQSFSNSTWNTTTTTTTTPSSTISKTTTTRQQQRDEDDKNHSSVIVTKATQIEASYGAAILAASTFSL
jgi:D-ribulokinase